MPTLTDILDAFLGNHRTRARLKPATLRAYRKDLAAAAAALLGPIEVIGAGDLAAYLDCAIAPSTATRRLAALRAFFAWAVREGICAVDPTASLVAPRRTRHLPRPIRADSDRATVERAIAGAPQPFRLALTILRETGMRAGEVLALNLGDVTLAPGREALHVREAKNGTERMVVLGPTATPKSLRGLRAHRRERRGEPSCAPLFRSNRGTRLSYDALHYQWGRLCLAAGLVDEANKPRYGTGGAGAAHGDSAAGPRPP